MGHPGLGGTLTHPHSPPACAGFGSVLRGCRNKTPLPKSGDHVAALPGAGLWASGSVETGRLGQQDRTVGGQQAPWACMPQLHGPWAPWRGTGHDHRSARTPFAGSRVGAGCLRQPKLRRFCLEGRLVPSLFTSRRRESKPSCVVCAHVWPCACAPCACAPCACLRVPHVRACVCPVCVPACAPCACLRVPRVSMCAPCASACACVCPVCVCVPHMPSSPHSPTQTPPAPTRPEEAECQQLPTGRQQQSSRDERLFEMELYH